MKITTTKDVILFIDGGTRSFLLPKDETVEVPPEFQGEAAVYLSRQKEMEQALGRASILPVTEHMPDPKTQKRVEDIVSAMRQLLDRGIPEVLDAAGIPKIGEIDALVGFRSNKADREAAWAIVEG